MKERTCYICEEPILDDDFEELENGEIVCMNCADEHCVKCENCENLFQEDEITEEDGKYYCENCHSELFGECYMCGKIVPIEDLQYWGDVEICPDCMENECPSFDEDENQEETNEAYEAMLKRYIGRKSIIYHDCDVDLPSDTSGLTIKYYLTVTLDKDGVITDVSRLTAEMMLSESERSSEWRPCAIDPDDYEWVVDDLMEELELEETEDDSSEE